MTEETINSEPVLSNYISPILQAINEQAGIAITDGTDDVALEVIDIMQSTRVKGDYLGVSFTIVNKPTGLRQNASCTCNLADGSITDLNIVGDPYKPFESIDGLIEAVGKQN